MSDISISVHLSLLGILPLILFAVWSVFLVLLIGAWRVGEVIGGKAAPNAFPAGIKHGSEMYWRLNRAHLNALENLPIFGALVLSGVALNVDSPSFATAAAVVFLARVVQSLIHISSGSVLAINLRFAAYAVQLVSFLVMAYTCLEMIGFNHIVEGFTLALLGPK